MRKVGGVVRNNTCFENFHAGIGHSDHAAPLVTGNKCSGNVRAGIGVSAGSSPVIRNNDCSQNRRAGIGVRMGADTRPVIEGNHCKLNGMAGIGSRENAEPIIRNNLCEKNEMAGIGAQLGAQPLIVGNHCRDNKLVAIGLPDEARAILVGNVLSRKGGMPPLIAVRGKSQAVLVDNALDGGGVAGVIVEGSAILSGNSISGQNENFGQGLWLWKGARAFGDANTISGFKATVTLAEGARWTVERP